MPDIFVAHAAEDEPLVRETVEQIESSGLSCWYFGRDQQPSQNYIEVVRDAIEQSRCVVVVVSRHSLESHDVDRELECAHRNNKSLLPILWKVSNNDIESKKAWDFIFGTATRLKYTTAAETAGQIVQSIDRPKQVEEVDSTVRPPIPNGPYWESDGSQVRTAQLKDAVFQTPEITRYILGDTQHFLSANKGLGKTLILRYKRAHITDQSDAAASGMRLIPEDKPYIDLMTSLPHLSRNVLNFLSDLRNCKRLWSVSIRLSVISHLWRSEMTEHLDLTRFPGELGRWMSGAKVTPTTVFKEIVISRTPKQINSLLDKFENVLDVAYRRCQSGISIFIDKVDQELRLFPREAWINVQSGLVEAAWECMNANQHVKVYGTIREEAFANYASGTRANLHSSVTSIRYTDDELLRMMDKLSQFYDSESFTDFVGLQQVLNARAGKIEDGFRYMHRHTVGRPRDMVMICSELARHPRNEESFREVVNNVSSDSIVSNVFEETFSFLDCLREKTEQQKLFSLIPCNILSQEEVKSVSLQFNGYETEPEDVDISSYLPLHVFSELWSCGLLGVVSLDDIHAKSVQRFKQPSDKSRFESTDLPHADYYLMHPSLMNQIRRYRGAAGYHTFRHIVVGHKYEWLTHFEYLINVQRELLKLGNSQTTRNVHRILQDVAPKLDETGHPTSFAGDLRGRIDAVLEQLSHQANNELAKKLFYLIEGQPE